MWLNIAYLLLVFAVGITLFIAINRLNQVLTAFTPVWSFVKNIMEVQKNESNASGNTNS